MGSNEKAAGMPHLGKLWFASGLGDGTVIRQHEAVMDGLDHGWSWRREGGCSFAAELSPGTHELRLELVPNGYNSCGPHHYYGGDWFVVSPDQMKGIRNFADPPDAPADTHVGAWHFRRFHLPTSVTFVGRRLGV